MSTTFAYRDDTDGMWLRHGELCELRAAENEALRGAEQVRRRRIARTVAGAVGIGAAAVIAGSAIARAIDHRGFHSGELTQILLYAWPAMGVAYAALCIDVRGMVRAAAAGLAKPADLRAEIARLERPLPVEEARERARRLELRSISVPLIALALLAPLSIHAVFCGMTRAASLDHFDGWIAASLAIVGHAHLVLAYVSHRFAKHLREHEIAFPGAEWGRHAMRAWGFTILASAIPGVVLFLLPPILTAVTGIAFIPLAFWAAARATMAERAALGEGVEA